jgi:iron complex outermembrane recepter protein
MYHRKYKQKSLHLALLLALSGYATMPAFAEEAAMPNQAVKQYRIPAGDLSSALQTLAGESSLILTFAPEQTAGKQSNGLNGNYTVEQAFEVLLNGTGLAARKNQNNQYYLIKSSVPATPAPGNRSAKEAETLPEVKVVDHTDNLASNNLQNEGKAVNGYKVDTISSVGALGKMKLQDTPFAISVVPQELIQNIQAQSPDDVYKLNPSTRTTTPQITGFSPNVNIRGFDGYNTAENGMRRPTNHVATMEDKERVEILNGLSGCTVKKSR